MYKNWKIEKWTTPFSNVKSLTMLSLLDKDKLTILLEAPREFNRPRWKVEFSRVPIYRNIMEEYRICLWEYLTKTSQKCGNSFKVVNSPLIAEFSEKESMFSVLNLTPSHYVITTEDDVIEVVSNKGPIITCLGPVSEKERASGKSKVLYNSQNRSEIKKSLLRIKSEKSLPHASQRNH